MLVPPPTPAVDPGATARLAAAVHEARAELARVVSARRRDLLALDHWTGPHAERHEAATRAALDAAGALDRRLAELAAVLRAEARAVAEA